MRNLIFLNLYLQFCFWGEKNSCINMLSLFAFQASFFTSLMLLHVNKWIFLKFPLNSFTIHPNLAGRQQENKSIKYQLQQRIFICRQYYIGLQNPNEIWINNLQKASPWYKFIRHSKAAENTLYIELREPCIVKIKSSPWN